MLVKIKRQASRDSAPYWQTFSCEGGKNLTVTALLQQLNSLDSLYDIEGKQASRIGWQCSCEQKLCGACAMVINGRPALACGTFLRDLKGETLVLEPLSKFPVIKDLIVDQSIIAENLKNAQVYLGEYQRSRAKDDPHLYSLARCLKCGLCLEACPNYAKGQNFFGPVYANEAYLMYAQSKDRKEALKNQYDTHFAPGCSKAFACVKVCPMGIDTLSSIARFNAVKGTGTKNKGEKHEKR